MRGKKRTGQGIDSTRYTTSTVHTLLYSTLLYSGIFNIHMYSNGNDILHQIRWGLFRVTVGGRGGEGHVKIV